MFINQDDGQSDKEDLSQELNMEESILDSNRLKLNPDQPKTEEKRVSDVPKIEDKRGSNSQMKKKLKLKIDVLKRGGEI